MNKEELDELVLGVANGDVQALVVATNAVSKLRDLIGDNPQAWAATVGLLDIVSGSFSVTMGPSILAHRPVPVDSAQAFGMLLMFFEQALALLEPE